MPSEPRQIGTQPPSPRSATESGERRLRPLSAPTRATSSKRALVAAFLLGGFVAATVGFVVAIVRDSPSYGYGGPAGWAKRRLHALRPFLREHAVAAELGVLKGEFSRLIVHELKPARLHLVDPWYLQGPEWTWEHGDRSTTRALMGILRDFESELARGQVVLNIAFDQDLLATFPDAYLDWAYIDTTHEYEQTKTELRLLQRKVKPSGVIAGDDWQPDPAHPHHGVYQAVQELIAGGQFRILYADAQNLQWAIGRVGPPSEPP